MLLWTTLNPAINIGGVRTIVAQTVSGGKHVHIHPQHRILQSPTHQAIKEQVEPTKKHQQENQNRQSDISSPGWEHVVF